MANAGRGSDQFVLRLPAGMRDRIKRAAEHNGRSMNAEIVERLTVSFMNDAMPQLDGPLVANEILAHSQQIDWLQQRVAFLCRAIADAHGIDMDEALPTAEVRHLDQSRKPEVPTPRNTSSSASGSEGAG